MRQTWRNLVIVLVAICVAVWSLMAKEFRLGKDLAGGVSIVYSVTMGPQDDPRDIMPRLIDVVKRRIDPNGLMDLTIVAQGSDRIEISLPAASETVRQRKQQFEEEIARLGRATLNEGRIDALVRSAEPARSRMLDELAVGSARRRELLETCIRTWDAAREKRAAYDAETDPAKKEALVPEVAEAEAVYERARAAAIAGTVSAEEIREIVRASTRTRVVSDRTGTETLPSPRDLAVERVKRNHPGMEADIDRLLKMYDDIYAGKQQTLDDPQELIRLLRGSGELSFRITVRPGEFAGEEQARQELRERGPKNVSIPGVKWCRINDIQQWINTPAQARAFREDPNYGVQFFTSMGYVAEPYAGDYYLLCYDTRQTRLTRAEGAWQVTKAAPGMDPLGRTAIDFTMNTVGAKLLGSLTQAHVGDQMAILLDDEVYTAPTLQSAISARGQITGSFSPEEIDYIVRVLAGGSLQAKLSPEPISINAVGPELGLDNLRMGLKAGLWSLAVVAAFMVLYYFACGAIAVVALMVNSLLILGAMALSEAAFTMPGIAGIILTFGMAVDSNVLIYERIREELGRGMDMKTAVRLGFERALASIVDGNITNLIVCIVLYYLGTTEIRGFAITMGIGVVSTLFAALVVSRLIFDLGLSMGWRRTSMLPMAIPALQRWLTPSVDWIRLRWVFFAVSTAYVALGLGMVYFRGAKMLDNEFLGGTQVTLQLRSVDDGKHLTMKRPEVERRVRAIADELPPEDPLGKRLKNAEVFPIDPEADGLTSHRFVVKTRPSDEELEGAGVQAEENRELVRLLLERFADVIETQPALEFVGSRETHASRAPAYPIDKAILGENIGRPDVTWDCREFIGGVAIVIERIDPPQPLSTIEERLRRTRQSEEFSSTLSRSTKVLLLDGTEELATGVVLLSKDEEATLFQSEARWEREMRDREWALVRTALAEESTPASVQTFSASIAGTFRANAIAATLVSFILIGIYIWVRFKTPRYSIAAVVALVHDVLTVIGLIALCEILYEWPATHEFAVAIGLLPFKIDLNAVAALLTIAGYSLNDTVVVMDRIRENRGKLPQATASIINLSVNQTFSRTIITGGTTMVSCLILYAVGGEGMRAFAFTLFTGLVVGTYSSVAVAAPIVWDRKFEREFAALGGLVPQTA